MIKEESFPALETCLQIDGNAFCDSDFVWCEHICGLYGDATEWRIEERDGREDDGITIVAAPTVYEMMLKIGTEDLHAVCYDALYPNGNLPYRYRFADNLLKWLLENVINW